VLLTDKTILLIRKFIPFRDGNEKHKLNGFAVAFKVIIFGVKQQQEQCGRGRGRNCWLRPLKSLNFAISMKTQAVAATRRKKKKSKSKQSFVFC